VALSEDMWFVELAKVEDGWLWHSDMIGNKPELGLGYFGRLAVERAKGRMGSSVDGEPIAWCG
jgi:hypothetical protein